VSRPRTCSELQNLAQEKGFLMWYHQARFFLGWASAVAGDRAGLIMMESSMDRFREAMSWWSRVFSTACWPSAISNSPRPGRRRRMWNGPGLVAQLGETFFEAPLLRLKARCLTGSGKADVEALFARAAELAREQGAVAWH